jgi:hypothetical protein
LWFVVLSGSVCLSWKRTDEDGGTVVELVSVVVARPLVVGSGHDDLNIPC